MTVRLKIRAKDLSGLDAVILECRNYRIKTYTVSEKRFMVSTGELPDELVRKFNDLGVVVIADTQYGIDLSNSKGSW